MPRTLAGNSSKTAARPRAAGEWILLSSHGLVFFYIATHPDCTVTDICDALFLSRRSVWSLVGNLRAAAMISVRSEGRRHHYTANLDTPTQHPAFGGKTTREMFELLISQARSALAKGR